MEDFNSAERLKQAISIARKYDSVGRAISDLNVSSYMQLRTPCTVYLHKRTGLLLLKYLYREPSRKNAMLMPLTSGIMLVQHWSVSFEKVYFCSVLYSD